MSVAFRGSRAELVTRLRALAAALAGTGPDPDDLARAVLTRGAIALLSSVQTSFIAKARGGVGADGIQWAPLKRATIAARRTSPGELKSLGIKGTRVRGFLTPAEDKRWRAIFAQNMARLRGRGIDGAEAMGIAARIAWAALKASGAKTKLEVLGGRVVQIGVNTAALLRSIEPGYEETPSGAADQVFQVEPGRVAVGSKIPYASHFHAKRPLWPADGPTEAMWEVVNRAILRGMLVAVTRIVSGA